MSIELEVIEGPNFGQKFRVFPGSRIGRSEGDIQLRDAKVSGLHAQVEKDISGELVLMDKKSSNGIKLNGVKVPKLHLMPGVIFQVGKTFFRVNKLETGKKGAAKARAEEPAGDVPVEEAPLDWRKQLEFWVPQMATENPPEAGQKIFVIDPILKLTVVGGPELDREIILGYGPRQAGSDVLDIELREESVPPLAFELLPDPEGVLFVTEYPQLVRLNDLSIRSKVLREGDHIRVGKTLIHVGFMAGIEALNEGKLS